MATGNWFLDFNLKMLNLWIGLCKGDRGLPTAIHELGFKQHGIEQKICNPDGSLCVPELIAYSRRLLHTLAFEWKSGRSTEDDQLSRYARLTAKALVDAAYVPKEAAKTFDVVMVCQAEHVDTVKIGIEKGSYNFPLLAVDGTSMRLVLNRFRCDKLNDVFSPGLEIDFASAPT